MKRKILVMIPFAFFCCLLLSVPAWAMSGSDIEIVIRSPVNSLANENGVIAVEQFPAEIEISTVAATGKLTDIHLEFNSRMQDIAPKYTLIIKDKTDCVPYTITATTDNGAVLTITANVVYQVKATYDIRYRTVGMLLKEAYDGKELLKSFPAPQYIRLENANTVAGAEKERIAAWIDRHDGKTYTLEGSLVVEVYNHATGKYIGTYDTGVDFDRLAAGLGWTPKTLTAFETMRHAALSYQAPVSLHVEATWCSEDKQEVYGKLTAQDKGVPELLFPYQTAEVTFTKDDIPLSRNYIYKGLEWDYTPETAEYNDGKSETQTAVTQKINTRIPAADFYFKFQKQSGNDLSVSIRAPKTVCRGASYSFTVSFTNSGGQPAYEVPLKGTVDNGLLKEIPGTKDFAANETKEYVIRRIANTSAGEIRLWAQIGIPEGFVDKNPGNNTATAVIRVVDPAPEPSTPPGTNPVNPDDPGKLPDHPPRLPELCDLSAKIIAPPTVYEHTYYRYTVSFTNLSGINLEAVLLQAKSNGDILQQIPQTVSFQPQEEKSFTVTGTAGSAGEVYLLWAKVEAPTGFTDKNPTNNTAVTKITVVKQSPGTPDDPDHPNPPDKPKNPDPPSPPSPTVPPDNPGKPDKPDKPASKTCDVWVNLSYPPQVYTQEQYSFMVYYTNDTDQELSQVSLQASIDCAAVSSIPSTADFKTHETKAFPVNGMAGDRETTLRLSASISPSEEYTDTNTGNNRIEAEIAVIEPPYDLDVQRITPDTYKENQTVVSTIKVSNKGSLDFTPGQKVSVQFEIPELSIKKNVNAVIMERDTWNVVAVAWDTPNVQADKSVTVIAKVSSAQGAGKEEDTANNTYTQKAVIKNVTYDTPEESRTIPVPPPRSEQPRVVWSEQRYEDGRFVWKSFYAELKVTAILDYDTKSKGFIKSGYGFGISVTATVDTNYDKPELITVPQTAEVYLPQYRYETAIPLMREGSRFTFKENPASPFGYKKQYVPVWFPDNRDYILQLLVTDAYTPGGTLSRWITGGELEVKVVDSMYSDDVTTGG